MEARVVRASEGSKDQGSRYCLLVSVSNAMETSVYSNAQRSNVRQVTIGRRRYCSKNIILSAVKQRLLARYDCQTSNDHTTRAHLAAFERVL